MATDTQRQRVYDWERKYIPRIWGAKMAEAEIRELMAAIAAHYGFKVPELVLKHMNKWAGTYQGYWNKVTLNPYCGLNRAVIIHEMAHAVCYFWREKVKSPVLQDGGHGDYFMAAYLDVLEHFSGLTAKEMVAIRANADPNNFQGSERRNIPKVACCAVYEDPTESPDMARRQMKCVQCNYPWVRHDMPFHRHQCAETYLMDHGKLPEGLQDMAPGKRRAVVVEAALAATAHLGWAGGWWAQTHLVQNAVPFRPTVADHVRKSEGIKARSV